VEIHSWKLVGFTGESVQRQSSSDRSLYLSLPALPGVSAGVFHYNSYLHALEPRAEVPETRWQQIKKHLHTDGFLVALTRTFWRGAWKYRERAFRAEENDQTALSTPVESPIRSTGAPASLNIRM
jgi:hypothetical protein